jgi:O-antigen ligase
MDLRYPLILIFLFRPLLDPLLEITKINISGQYMGIGALLNGSIILLTGLLLLKEKTCLNKVTGRHNWLIFLALCFISLFISEYRGAGFRLFLNFLSYFCLFLLPFILIKKTTELFFWLRLLLASGLLVIISGMVDFFRGGTFHSDAQMIRIQGAFLHPNILAFYLILLIIICIFVSEERIKLIPRFQRFLLSLMICSSGILLLETKTRNAWITLWLLLLFYSFFRDKRYIVPLVLFPLVGFLSPAFRDRVVEVVTAQYNYTPAKLDAFAWRVSMWKSALPQIWHSPIIGHGLASFQPISGTFADIVGKRGGGAHNVFLQLAFEIGIPGLIAYLSIHGVLIYTFVKNVKKDIRILLVLLILSYCVISSADNTLNYLPYNWHYWFFVGLTLVYIRGDNGQIQCHNTSV